MLMGSFKFICESFATLSTIDALWQQEESSFEQVPYHYSSGLVCWCVLLQAGFVAAAHTVIDGLVRSRIGRRIFFAQ